MTRMRGFLRAHAALLTLLVVGSIVAAIVYELTSGGKPRASAVYNRALNQLDLLGGEKPRELWNDDDFECVGWRATYDCNPFGQRDYTRDRGCDEPPPRTSGYCEIRNRTSGETFKVMKSTCSGWRWWLVKNMTCNDARQFTDFSIRAARYTHLPPLDDPSKKTQGDVIPSTLKVDSKDAFKRGIAMIGYPKVIAGVYAIVRMLRHHGCTLPVEVWIDPLEMTTSHSVLKALVTKFNVIVRTITDPSATKFHTKPYALYHSYFDSVLFLDSDNIPAKDPTYLFDSHEFKTFGAIFWPDFWRPTPTTPFNVHQQNVVWQLLDMPFIDMFEGESGQLIVNRTRSKAALEKLMFYSSQSPKLLNDYELVYGDKDLFRFAWLNTSTPFFYVQHLVALGGVYSEEEDFFCGVSMVQRDPKGEIVFMHRNQAKLNGRKDQKVVITHLQKFTGGNGGATSLPSELDKYRIYCKTFRLGLHNCFYIHPQTSSGDKTPILLQSLARTTYPVSEQQAITFSIEGRQLLSPAEEAEIAEIERKAEVARKKEEEGVIQHRRKVAREDHIKRLVVIVAIVTIIALYAKPMRIWRRYQQLRAAKPRTGSSSVSSSGMASVPSAAVESSWRRKKSFAIAGEDQHIL